MALDCSIGRRHAALIWLVRRLGEPLMARAGAPADDRNRPQALAGGASAGMFSRARDHVADLAKSLTTSHHQDRRSPPTPQPEPPGALRQGSAPHEPGETVSGRARGPTAARERREAGRQLGRPLRRGESRGTAPTTRSTSLPSRITTSNGIDCAPNLVASPGFASTSTFTTFRCPA